MTHATDTWVRPETCGRQEIAVAAGAGGSISCSTLERTGAVAHLSKPRLFLQGMTGELRWRHGEVERLGIIEPRIAERISRRSWSTRRDVIVRGVRQRGASG